MSKDKAEYYRAKEGFGTMFDGEPVHVAAGELVRAGHPILKRREDLFEPVTSFGRFDVEQATSAPGEKRGGRKTKKEEPAAAPEPPKDHVGLQTKDIGEKQPEPEKS